MWGVADITEANGNRTVNPCIFCCKIIVASKTQFLRSAVQLVASPRVVTGITLSSLERRVLDELRPLRFDLFFWY
jgi:hypothetical protein